MIKKLLTLIAFAALFYACSTPAPTNTSQESSRRDSIPLETIIDRGKLVVYTENSITSYFIYKGQPMGYDYEMLHKFAQELGVDLEVRLLTDVDDVMDSIAYGKGDIAAGNYTVTKSRKEKVSFTHPLLETNQVLVQRLPENYWKYSEATLNDSLVRDPLELVGKAIHVRKSSSFYQRLLHLEEEIGADFNIIEADQGLETDDLIRQVSEGKIDYTIADRNVALVNQHFYDNLDIETPISLNQRIAWMVNKDAFELQDTINSWIEANKKSALFAVTYNKYFTYRSQHKARIDNEYTLVDSGNISPYDDLLKHYAKEIHWDWRLLSAVVFYESRFKKDVSSWTGAIGLMQILPSTAATFGVDSVSLWDPAMNIKAGTAFLNYLSDYWYEQVPDTTEAQKFALASYNVGLGHIKDAQRLAEKYDKDPLVWKGNVEDMLLHKSEAKYYRDEVVKHGYCRGYEPVRYVNSIYNRYNDYKNFTR
tara:strand:+ start:2166 stop:3602 length:1437 start_codon:yes stop_codon:yes gene_type:complete